MARTPIDGVFTQEVLDAPDHAPKGPLQAAQDNSGKQLTNQDGYTFTDTAQRQQANVDQLQRQADTFSTGQQSFVAGIHSSLLGSMYDALTMPGHASQDNYTPDLPSLPGYTDKPASEDESRALRAASSTEDLSARWDFIQDNRRRAQQMQDNPVAGIAGALLGDAPLVVAGFGAGAVAAGVGAGARGVLAAESAVGAAEAAGTTYAYSRNPNVHGLDIMLPALGLAAGGVLGLRRIRTASGADDVVSDSEGILTRQSRDVSGTAETPTIQPVTIQPGELWAGSIKGKPIKAFAELEPGMDSAQRQVFNNFDIDDDLVLRVHADSTKPAQYNASTHTISIAVPHSANGKSITSIGDALKLLDSAGRQTLRHELVHAATVRRLQTDTTLRTSVENLRRFADVELAGDSRWNRYMTSPEEFVAGLADPEFNRVLQRLDVPEQLGAEYMRASTGSTVKADSALFKAFNEHLQTGADADASAGLKSSVFFDLNSVKANSDTGAAELKKGFLQKLGERTGITKHLSLYDRVSYAGEKSKALADRLFTNGAGAGSRQDSAADQLRLLQVQSAPEIQAVHASIEQQLISSGISRREMVQNTSRYRAARQQLQERVVYLMDRNSNRFMRGEAPEPVPADLQVIVDSLQTFSKNWRERLNGTSLADAIADNPWYIPRKYEYSRQRKIMAERDFSRENIRSLFTAALRDAYPAMDRDLTTRVGRAVEEGIWGSGANAQRRTWQENMGIDQLEEALQRSGLEPGEIQGVLAGTTRGSENAASPRLRGRTQLDTSKTYIIDGREMKLQDLMQTDIVSLTDGYVHSMSGRLALARTGIDNPRTVQELVDEAAQEVSARDAAAWGAAIDDGMNQLLGIGERTPQAMQIAQNFASATMLRNSGLYQLVDTSIAMYERGLGNWFRALKKESWAGALSDTVVVNRLSTLLDDAAMARDTRFRYLQAQVMDKQEYRKADLLETASTNAAQLGMTLNGMRLVTRAQAGINSKVIINTLLDMLEGNPEAVKYMQSTGGLSAADIAEMQRLHRANPGAVFEDARLRNRFENAGLRLQDLLTQQNRIGELPAWATGTAAGRVLVGFMRFTLAAHNKIMRRILKRDGVYGLMVLAAYQAPLMLLAQSVRQARDGNNPFDEKTQERILADTASNLSAWGIAPAAFDFTSGNARISNPAIGWLTNFAAAPSRILDGQDPVKVTSQLVPVLGLLPVKAVTEAGKALAE